MSKNKVKVKFLDDKPGDDDSDTEGEGEVPGERKPYKTQPIEIGWVDMDESGNVIHPEEGVGNVYFKNITWDPGYCIGVFGARGSGKSFFLRWWLWLVVTYYPIVYVFTNTKMNCYWKGYINEHFIFQGYREDKLLAILKDQRKRVDAWREGCPINPYCLIIWDDCLPKDLQYDPLFQEIFFNGRHYHIGNIMNSQYFFRIPKGYRGNLDWVVSMKQNQSAQLEAFFQEMSYAGKGFDKFNEFLAMFVSATRNNQVIIFDVRDQTKDPIDKIYTATAEDPGIFWVGDELYWSKNRKQLEDIKSGKMKERIDRKVPWEKLGIVNVWEQGLAASNVKKKK